MSIQNTDFTTIIQYGRRYCDPPVKSRPGCRAIIVKEGKILLSYETNTKVYMSPGGGLEKGETLEECCTRELQEEAGYIVNPVKRFVTINEYFDDTLYINNYFICEITGTCQSSLTEIEIAHGITPVWVDINDALKIFGKYESKRDDIASLYLREFTVINKYLESEI